MNQDAVLHTVASPPKAGSALAGSSGNIVKRAGLLVALSATVLLVIFALIDWPWMGYMTQAA